MAREALRSIASGSRSEDPGDPGDPPDEGFFSGLYNSVFGAETEAAASGPGESRFRKSGPLGLSEGPSVRMSDAEKELMSGLAEEGYAPSQMIPMEVGESGSQAARYTLPEEAGGAIEEGAIRMAPMREGIGEGAAYNARTRQEADVAAEEVAHDLTLSDTTRSQEIARDVAARHDADPDSLANLMTTSFDEPYSERPQEKLAKSLVPAVKGLAGAADTSDVSGLHMDLARQLLQAHQNVPAERRGALQQMIQSRPSGVDPADPIE